MKLTFVLMNLFLVAACVPEKSEEKKIDSMIQQDMDLHKHRMQGFGDIDPESERGFFGGK